MPEDRAKHRRRRGWVRARWTLFEGRMPSPSSDELCGNAAIAAEDGGSNVPGTDAALFAAGGLALPGSPSLPPDRPLKTALWFRKQCGLFRKAILTGGVIVGLLAVPMRVKAADAQKEPAAWEQQARAALERGEVAEAQNLAAQKLSDPASAAVAHLLLGVLDLRQQRHSTAVTHFEAAKALGEQREELFLCWSESLQKLGRLAEACRLLEKELEQNPSLPALNSRLADLYLALGKPRQALRYLEEVYRQGRPNAAVTLRLASARFAAGQDYRAVELLEPLVGAASSANLLLQIGKLYFRNLLYRKALIPLQRAWELSKPSYEAGMFLALTFFQLGEYASCAGFLDQIKPDAAEELDYRTLKGSVLARLGEWEGARRELERGVEAAADRADGYLNLGLFWMERGDREKAWELLEKGSWLMTPGTKVVYTFDPRQTCDGLVLPKGDVAVNKDRARFFADMAERFHKVHHWTSALELFRAALEADPRLKAPYAGIGLICPELGNPDVGRSFLAQGVDLYPAAADLRFYLGTVLSALGRHEEALSSFLKALELGGPNPPARHWLFLGIAQAAGNKEKHAEAKVSFLRAVEADPQLALAHYELGKWHLKNGDPEGAEKSLQRAIELDPHLVGAYYQLGIACRRNGKSERARELMAVFQQKKALREPSSRAVPAQDRLTREP